MPYFKSLLCSPQIKEESVVRLYDVGRLRADEQDLEDMDDDDENANGDEEGEEALPGEDDDDDEDDDMFPLDSGSDSDDDVQCKLYFLRDTKGVA